MASSNSRHVRNGVRGSGGVGDTLQMGGRGASNGEKRWKFGRRKVIEAFAMGRWGVRNENRA